MLPSTGQNYSLLPLLTHLTVFQLMIMVVFGRPSEFRPVIFDRHLQVIHSFLLMFHLTINYAFEFDGDLPSVDHFPTYTGGYPLKNH